MSTVVNLWCGEGLREVLEVWGGGLGMERRFPEEEGQF